MPPDQSLQKRYQTSLSIGAINRDSAQAEAVDILQNLADRLQGYRPPAAHGIVANFLRNEAAAPQGLYLHGDVGRGKSMLMDLFFDSVPLAKKRRVHFHQFMLETHARLHALQTGPDQAEGVIPRLAEDLAREAWLLCFDEFHVGNIADAMILGRLFSALFDNGVVVVATSNWPPDELYKNGLQRDRFLPFIDLIKQHMQVHRIEGAVDHRLEQMRGAQSWFMPLEPQATAKLEAIFDRLTGGAPAEPLQLPVQGRVIEVPRAARGIAFFTFEELCAKPLGSADYLAIAECFPTVIVDKVPQLSLERRNETVRFMTLIDALYESKTKVFIAAEASPDKLCEAGEHAFAFQRTASRLIEMQSEEYRQKAHLG